MLPNTPNTQSHQQGHNKENQMTENNIPLNKPILELLDLLEKSNKLTKTFFMKQQEAMKLMRANNWSETRIIKNKIIKQSDLFASKIKSKFIKKRLDYDVIKKRRLNGGKQKIKLPLSESLKMALKNRSAQRKDPRKNKEKPKDSQIKQTELQMENPVKQEFQQMPAL